MNKLTIIGNLTKDPELRTTPSGISVCSFSVAVNRRKKDGPSEADFFKVTAWRELGENCGKFLQKGRKVCVIGPVSLETYQGRDGKTYADMTVQAQDVEFLTSIEEAQRMASEKPPEPTVDQKSGFEKVETDDLPF